MCRTYGVEAPSYPEAIEAIKQGRVAYYDSSPVDEPGRFIEVCDVTEVRSPSPVGFPYETINPSTTS